MKNDIQNNKSYPQGGWHCPMTKKCTVHCNILLC